MFRSCSLEELGPEDDNVVLAFKQLAREFEEKFNNQFIWDMWKQISDNLFLYITCCQNLQLKFFSSEET